MKRVPIRLRLTLVFVAMMTAILFAAGLFIYARLQNELDRGLNHDLYARSADLLALVRGEDSGIPEIADLRSSGLGGPDQGSKAFVQIVSPAGSVLAALPARGTTPGLTQRALGTAVKRPVLFDTRVRGSAERYRVYAQTASSGAGRLVLVAGVSLAGHDSALHRLVLVLLIAGPAALLLAAIAAYALAAAALRPVESMRRRTMSISAAAVEERVPIPPARDEIARLGESLNEMLDRLEAALRHERAFVADASHELRTPLGLVKTELELALSNGSSLEELHAALTSAAEENDRAVALANDLLVLARADENRLALRVDQVAVADIFEDIRERFRRRAKDSGRLLATEPTDGLNVFADRLRITQALSNLVDNAFRHGAGDVCLLANTSATGIELHVQDHGRGFPGDFLPRAFDRFARAGVAPSISGSTGLGLAIVKTIACAHNGNAYAANSVWGAHVWISIPQPGSSETGELADEKPIDLPPAPGGAGARLARLLSRAAALR